MFIWFLGSIGLGFFITEDIVSNGIENIQGNIKGSFIHRYIQRKRHQTKLIGLNDTIFMVHIPRTSMDTIRSHMFADYQVLIDYSKWKSSYMPFMYYNDYKYIFDSWDNKDKKVIKGFISMHMIYEYIKMYPNRNIKLVTFLRHPVERVLSLYYFLNNPNSNCIKNKLIFNIEMNNNGDYCLTLTQFLKYDNSRLQSLISNGMTWQLSYHILLDYRSKILNNNGSTNNMDAYALQMAKHNLKYMFDYIGFYEDIYHDFDGLYDKIFQDYSQNNNFLRFLFNLGGFIGLPRLRVTKYSNRINKNDLNMIIDKNKYDFDLYNYGLNITNKTFRMYSTYFNYLRNF